MPFLWKILIPITISFVTAVTALWRCDGRHTPPLIGFFYRNQLSNPHGLGTIQSQIYSNFLKQLKFCKSVKKCAKYPTVHFFFGTGFSHFQRYFSTSSLSLKLKCFTLAEIAKLYLQTVPFGILILLPGAEKKSFESVSNVTGHPVYWGENSQFEVCQKMSHFPHIFDNFLQNLQSKAHISTTCRPN